MIFLILLFILVLIIAFIICLVSNNYGDTYGGQHYTGNTVHTHNNEFITLDIKLPHITHIELDPKFGTESIWVIPINLYSNPLPANIKESFWAFYPLTHFQSLIFKKSLELNNYHKTKHTERFWQILVGHWLRIYIDTMINRINILEECVQDYKLSGTTAF